MKRKMSLKIKLTIMSVVILTTMCIALAASTIFIADSIVSATLTTPAKSIGPSTEATVTQDSVPSVDAALGQFRGNTIVVMICLIVFGSVLTYVFASKTLKPLEHLTKTVDNININNLDENIPIPHTGDEVDRLTQSFNDMTTKLNQSYQVQKNFSANAAHELRTPLAMLQTQVEVFQMKSDRSATEYNALLQSITESTDRLSHLVNDLLSFTNEQEIDLSYPVDLRSLLDETVFELEEAAEAKQIQVTVSGEGTVYGNDSLLQRAFYNLITNAIRYNVDGGCIDIQIESSRVIISDTGIGIPDEAKPNIFNTFFCVDKSRSRELGGSGLGLAIVKNIIEKHNGYIYVKNNLPQGSVFVVGFDKKEFE